MKEIKRILSLIKDQWTVILVYLGTIFFTALTFYLYGISLTIYRDMFLFSLLFFLIVMIIKIFNAYRKDKIINQVIANELIDIASNLFTPTTTIEKDFYRLVLNFEDKLEETNSTNRRKYDELKDYYIMWSHQIKTPLAALSLLAQTDTENSKEDMNDEIFKIQQYLDMMLQYLRMQDINQDFYFANENLLNMVKPIIQKFKAFILNQNLDIELDNLDHLVLTDKKWFMFILEQVIFNAIKYTEKGSIHLFAKVNEDKIIFTVEDTGRGIAATDLPRVFEKGFTGLNGRIDRKATGLGLYMSKEIAEKLGIELSISSKVNVGTAVNFVFDNKKKDIL
ncbi:MAG: sensor histidine kinase [Lachnospiraceae bacterium]|jgi:signal transduction histidine kinase|nr:sensor histidine kinase [Lachnospiraceae bacterium]